MELQAITARADVDVAVDIAVDIAVDAPSLTFFQALAGSALEVYFLDCKPAGILSCSAVIDSGEQDGSQSFRVEFVGQPDRLLAQDTYQLRAADGTSFPIFLVPVGADDEEVRYEACFNQAIA